MFKEFITHIGFSTFTPSLNQNVNHKRQIEYEVINTQLNVKYINFIIL